ncbi:CHASE2 domain-containing protein [Candidatus Neomarinimicrobiota bacterium]
MTDLVDGYEYRSYDARFKARASGSLEESIDTVLIVDIDQQSIDDLGNYFRWFHDYHGDLIDFLESGNPKAIAFDVLFDPEPDPTHDTSFVRATYAGQNVYHAIALSEADTLNFRPPMDSPPTGFYRHIVNDGETLEDIARSYYGDAQAADYIYSLNEDIIGTDRVLADRQVVRISVPFDTSGKLLQVPDEVAHRFPSGERFDIAFIDLLNASKGVGSANFPQDKDGVIRKSPTGVYFKSANQVYPSLTMAVAMDLLDVPKNGLEYDFENLLLSMRNRSGDVVRTIPIDEQGRVYVNYFGTHRTFRYLPYSWINPDMIPADYFTDKVIIIGSTLAGLMDLRTTPVQETFPGVEIHANVMMSYLTDSFVQPISRADNIKAILLLGFIMGAVLVHFKIILSLVIAIIVAAGWILFAYTEFFSALIVWEVVRPVFGIGLTFLAENAYKYLVLEKDKRFLRKSFSTYISPELIDQLVDEGIEPELGGSSDILTAYFTDIQSFSSFSEILTAAQLVELLNEYLTGMTDILLEHGGYTG